MATNGMTINGLNPLSALTADDKIPVWDTGASGEPTKEITAQNMANSVKSLASLPNTTEMNTAISQSTALVDASASNVTVAAGAFRIDIAVSVPTGYTMAGVLAWNFGARVNVSITGIDASGGYVRIFGTNNGASTTVNPTAKVLCVKQ